MFRYKIVPAGKLESLESELNDLASQDWYLHSAIKDAGGDLFWILEKSIDPYIENDDSVVKVLGNPAVKSRGRPRKKV